MSKRYSLFALLLLTTAAAAQMPKAPLFKPGDQVPELKVAEWMRGEPFKGWDKNKLSVVEFWATWCVPCKEAMPHLSALAKKYAGEIGFYSISIQEQAQMVPDGVRKFVRENQANMQYSVGRDADGKLDSNYEMFYWFMGSKQRGIPVAYIVDHAGKLLWLGHPLDLDSPLADASAGRLDVAKERKKFEQFLDDDAKTDAFLAKLAPFEKRFESGQRKEAFRDLDAAAGRNPDFMYMAEREKIRMLAIYDPSGCLEFLKGLRKRIKRDQWWRYMMELVNVDPRVKDKDAYRVLQTQVAEGFMVAAEDKDAWLLAYAGWLLATANKQPEAARAFDRSEVVFAKSAAAKDSAEKTRFDSFLKQQRAGLAKS